MNREIKTTKYKMIFMRIRCFIFLVILTSSAISQWSTLPYTQNALWVCPGFNSDIVTYPDGSSIIIGIGDNNEIWMQKLDANGYKQWLPYVTVFPAMNNALRYFLPDDDGGIYAIIGSKAQRIDKNGFLRWGENGKQIIPLGSLTKAITDGKNGFIGVYNYLDSLQRVMVFRYDSSGTKIWEKQIDSSITQGSISGNITGRLGNKTLLFTTRGDYKTLDLNGHINSIDSSFLTSFFFLKETDTSAYNIQLLSYNLDFSGWAIINEKIIKLNTNWDTVWTTNIQIKEEPAKYLGLNQYFSSDGFGGLFNFSSYYDSTDMPSTRIRRIIKSGYIDSERGYLIKGLAGRNFFNNEGKLGFVDDFMQIQIIDTVGNKLWPDTFKVIIDNTNSYFENVEGDNNGGAIISFWTVAGGIKVQHTGRVGKVGVITKVLNHIDIIKNYNLFQNYPNPFNPTTRIEFQLPVKSDVSLKIYDLLGREVTILVNERQETGTYSMSWNASQFSSGIYFAVMRAGSFTATKKLILMK